MDTNAYRQWLAEYTRRSGQKSRDAITREESLRFTDKETGFDIWKLTRSNGVDQNDYYDLPSWNADGSKLIFFSSRGETGELTRWWMNANGTNIEPLRINIHSPGNESHLSRKYPNRMYHWRSDEEGTELFYADIFTGKNVSLVKSDHNLGDLMPPNPAEEVFLFGRRAGRDNKINDSERHRPSRFHLLSLVGDVKTFELERNFHRLRYANSPDNSVFYNFDLPREQFLLCPETGKTERIGDSGQHPSWSWDGSRIFYFASLLGEVDIPGIYARGPEFNKRELITPLYSGGHGAATLDGRFLVADTPHHGTYPGAILAIDLDSGVEQVLTRHGSSYLDHTSKGWHREHHSTHPHACCSPDGTKVLFNSDALGAYTDLYMVKLRDPEPPRVTLNEESGAMDVIPPENSREHKEYRLYGLTKKNMFCFLGSMPIEPSFTPPEETSYGPTASFRDLALTVREHSGLESRLNWIKGSLFSPEGYLDSYLPDNLRLRCPSPSAHALTLLWDAISLPGGILVSHYQVYCGETPDFTGDSISLVGSVTHEEFTDWGLRPDREYYYRISAVDPFGNETLPSPAVSFRTLPFEALTIELNGRNVTAFSGVALDEFEELGDEAFRSIAPRASVTWEFFLPREGMFHFWLKSIHSRNKPCLFAVYLDDEKLKDFRLWGPFDEPIWTPLGPRITGDPQWLRLSEGKHKLELVPMNRDSLVQMVRITDDPQFRPLRDR